MGKISSRLELIVWLLPASAVKNRCLRYFGHSIAASATVGPNIVIGLRKAKIGEDVLLRPFNVIRGLGCLILESQTEIGSWNWISAHPAFQEVDTQAGTLILRYRSRIGSRCYIDTSGTVDVRDYGNVGGNRCFLQTHEPDFANNRQTVGRITVGAHSMAASTSVMLKNSVLPDRSLLAANSTMRAAADRRPGLYAGSPAVWKKETPATGWFTRDDREMTEHVIEGQMGLTP